MKIRYRDFEKSAFLHSSDTTISSISSSTYNMKISISLPDDLVKYLDQQVENRSQLIQSLLQKWRKNQEDQEMVEACALLDELNLGWDEECEQAGY